MAAITKLLGFLGGGSKTADNVFDKDNGLLTQVGGIWYEMWRNF